jgi:lipopolysaccharide export system protein LptA
MLRFIRKTSLLLLVPLQLYAAEHVNPIGNFAKSEQPIDITSQNLTIDQEKHLAVFTGEVIAIQGETKLYADQMDVVYKPKEEDKKEAVKDEGLGDIQTIITKGNVKIIMPEKHASAANGVYDVKSANITLTGNVVMVQGKNVLKGDKFIHNINTNKSEMISLNKNKDDRVKALFTPKKKKDNETKQ